MRDSPNGDDISEVARTPKGEVAPVRGAQVRCPVGAEQTPRKSTSDGLPRRWYREDVSDL